MPVIDHKFYKDRIAELEAKLYEWEKLKDANVLHANLLRGFPAKLSDEQLTHLFGSNKITELEQALIFEQEMKNGFANDVENANAKITELEAQNKMMREALEKLVNIQIFHY